MAKVIIDRERCKGCGLCLNVCPRHLLSRSDTVNRKGIHPATADLPEQCTGCKLCVTVCPDVAIRIADE